jgi:hypothetical protein
MHHAVKVHKRRVSEYRSGSRELIVAPGVSRLADAGRIFSGGSTPCTLQFGCSC